MPETTQINKIRQRKTKNTGRKIDINENKPVSSYFYPKNHLYTKHEFELLDTIYSDEPQLTTKEEQETRTKEESFWPQNKELYFRNENKKASLRKNAVWFLGGIALASIIWFTFFQIKVNEIKSDESIQIVFHKSAQIVTDKTIDGQVTKALTKEKQIELAKADAGFKFPSFSNMFSKKPKVTKEATLQHKVELAENKPQVGEKTTLTYHVIQNGDSLWLIAKEYYGDPSPQNIEKIKRANDLRTVKYLYPGKKLVIPL